MTAPSHCTPCFATNSELVASYLVTTSRTHRNQGGPRGACLHERRHNAAVEGPIVGNVALPNDHQSVEAVQVL